MQLVIIADSRTAIMSILMLIVAGVILLFFVDVEEGARVAAEEDAKFRANLKNDHQKNITYIMLDTRLLALR